MNVAPTSPKRPFLVWVICVFWGLSAVMACISLWVVFSGVIRVPANVAQFYGHFGLLNFVALTLGLILMLGSVIQLFRLRKSAIYFVTAAFAFGFLQQLWYWSSLAQLGQGTAKQVIGQLISLVIVLYSWRLLRLSVLR